MRGATDETVKNFLIVGVRVGTDFWKELQRKEPPTLAALYLLAEPYKREEEALASITRHDASSSRSSRQKKRDRTPSPRKKKKNTVNALDVRPISEKRNSPPHQPSPIRRRSDIDHYTPLVASIEHIFEVKKKDRNLQETKPTDLYSSQR